MRFLPFLCGILFVKLCSAANVFAQTVDHLLRFNDHSFFAKAEPFFVNENILGFIIYGNSVFTDRCIFKNKSVIFSLAKSLNTLACFSSSFVNDFTNGS